MHVMLNIVKIVSTQTILYQRHLVSVLNTRGGAANKKLVARGTASWRDATAL